MEALPYTVINSQNQHKLYCERLEDLVSIKKKDPGPIGHYCPATVAHFMLGRRAAPAFGFGFRRFPHIFDETA